MGLAPLAFATPDAIVLAFVLLLTIRGAIKGFIWTLVRTAGLVAGYLLAARFDAAVGTFLAAHFSFVPAANSDIVGWVAIIVVAYVIATVAAYLAKGSLREVSLGGIDRLLGAALGATLGFLICAFAFTLWASTKPKEEVRATFSGSFAASFMARAVREVTPLFSDGVRRRWQPVFSTLDE